VYVNLNLPSLPHGENPVCTAVLIHVFIEYNQRHKASIRDSRQIRDVCCWVWSVSILVHIYCMYLGQTKIWRTELTLLVLPEYKYLCEAFGLWYYREMYARYKVHAS